MAKLMPLSVDARLLLAADEHFPRLSFHNVQPAIANKRDLGSKAETLRQKKTARNALKRIQS